MLLVLFLQLPARALRVGLIQALAAMKYILALVILVLASIPIEAAACSCVPPGTVQQERDRSTRVFLGRVTSVEHRTPQMDRGWLTVATDWVKQLFGKATPFTDRDYPYKRVTFAVTETFKGSPIGVVKLSTGMGGGDCGYFFEHGEEYVVYARGEESMPTAGICSRTGRSSDPSVGLQLLRSGS